MASTISSPSSISVEPEIYREGITVLSHGVIGDIEKTSWPQSVPVDYILLHGLNGHPKRTWTHQSGFYWPLQLTKDIPGARVMVFGYNADFERSWTYNRASIKSIAESLVSALIDEREGDAAHRLLILVAHSLGGLVVKRAIVNLHRDDSAGFTNSRIQAQNDLYNSIVGLVFLGTPHAGSGITQKATVKTLQLLAKASFKNAPDKLLNALGANSDELLELSDNFAKTTIFVAKGVQICTYYETRTTTFLGEEVVPEAMTILHYQNERREGIPADHANMVKYNDEKDRNYVKVMKELRRMGTQGLSGMKTRQEPAEVMRLARSHARIAEASLSCCRSKLGEAGLLDGEFHWFHRTQEYLDWATSNVSTILWHSGPPRSGKTNIMCRTILNLIGRARGREKLGIAFYFCDCREEGTFGVPVQILRSLVCQLLSDDQAKIDALISARMVAARKRDNLRLGIDLLSTDPELASNNASLFLLLNAEDVTLSQLWELLRDVLRMEPLLETYIILDGVEMIEYTARSAFLRNLLEVWKELQRTPDNMTRILIASRLEVDIEEALKELPRIDRDTERRNCLRTLFFDKLHARRDLVPDPQEGTNQWIWSHRAYLMWLRERSSILWIQGKAGSGKSTLAKLLQRSLLSESRRSLSQGPDLIGDGRKVIFADYFYSARGGLVGMSHEMMLRSLLYQVLDQEPRLFPLYQTTFRRLVALSHGQLIWPYEDLRTIFVSLAGDNSIHEIGDLQFHVCFLIDAMDESEDEEANGRCRSHILSLFADLYAKRGTNGIKAIIISRPANDIERKLGGFYHIEMQQENEADIMNIINSKVGILEEYSFNGQLDLDRSLSLGSGDYRTNQSPRISPQGNEKSMPGSLNFVRSYLLQYAQGVILWVVLITEELIRFVQRGFYTIREIKEKLESLPRSLEAVYADIVGDLRRLQSQEVILQARLMLTWATFPEKPLILEEFRDAIAISVATVSKAKTKRSLTDQQFLENRIEIPGNNWTAVRLKILDTCRCLLDIVRPKQQGSAKDSMGRLKVLPGDVVQLAHQTVRGFLISDGGAEPLNLDQAQGQRMIAAACYEYLKLTLPTEPFRKKYIDKWTQDDYEAFVQRLNDRPLLAYILNYLDRHCQQTGWIILPEYLSCIGANPDSSSWAFLEKWSYKIHMSKWSSPNITPFTIGSSHSTSRFRSICLGIAARKGYRNAVLVMLTAGFNPTNVDIYCGATPLVDAVRNGHEGVVRLLVDTELVGSRGDFFEKTDPVGLTAVEIGSARGHASIVSFLIGRGAKAIGILQAAQNGHVDVVKILAENGANVDYVDWKGDTPLGISAANGHTAVVEYLLCKGASKYCDRPGHQSSIARAFANGHRAIAWRLGGNEISNLTLNPPSHFADPECRTPLEELVAEELEELFNNALSGNEGNSTSRSETTPTNENSTTSPEEISHIAESESLTQTKVIDNHQQEEQEEIIVTDKILPHTFKRKRTDGSMQDTVINPSKRSVLAYRTLSPETTVECGPVSIDDLWEFGDIPTQQPNNQDITHVLARIQYDVTQQPSRALMRIGDRIINALCEYRVKIKAVPWLHDAMLCIAAHKGHVEVLQQLLSQEQKDSQAVMETLALRRAIMAGHVDAACLLLEHGAVVEVREFHRYTEPVLVIAALNHDVAMTRLLLESGANPYARHIYGYTAFDVASLGDNDDVLEVLAEHWIG